MKTKGICILILAGGLCGRAHSEEFAGASGGWYARVGLGGNIPENPSLTLHDGPVTGGNEMELSAGVQFDLTLGYRIRPWLGLEGEMGMSYNEVDRVGNWRWPNSSLSQLSFMGNVVVERPRGRLVPFAGIGAGGVVSRLAFGEYSSYYFSSVDGEGTDVVPAAQVFAGLRCKLSERGSLDLRYRMLVIDRQQWDVDWWNGNDFKVGVDSFLTHSITLAFTWDF